MPVLISGSGPITGLTSIASPTTINGLTIPTAGFGKVLKVVTTLKQDTFTTSSTTYVDVTGLSATITPVSASNTIVVMVTLTLASNTDSYLSRGVVLRGSTPVGAGTASGNRPAANFLSIGRPGYAQTAVFVDSPATTSATTYKVQIASESTATATVGRGFGSDGDVSHIPRVASSITLLEIAT